MFNINITLETLEVLLNSDNSSVRKLAAEAAIAKLREQATFNPSRTPIDVRPGELERLIRVDPSTNLRIAQIKALRKLVPLTLSGAKAICDGIAQSEQSDPRKQPK